MTPIQNLKYYLKGCVLSYAQVFFSNSLWLGLLLMTVTFFDFGVGISGLIAILTCQLCSLFFSFNKQYIFDGFYTYSALMVGLAMGCFYQLNGIYIFVLIIASILTFFLTVWLSGRLSLIGLPTLSLPFLITIWTLLLGLSNFSGIKLVGKEIFSLQQWSPHIFQQVSSLIDKCNLSDIIHLYLRSLSANIFQYNDLAGIVIAAALLLHSRMSFALSIYGFLIGYFFYHHLEGDFTPLIYSYIGFNFILTSIALGGFFIVPSTKSYLLLLFVIPVTALLLSAMHTLFSHLHIPLYSLPFNIVVLIMIGVLQMRQSSGGLQLVTLQQYSPELNHYKFYEYQKRFAGQSYYHVYLPFIGEWNVSQGHEGNITHKEGWRHAWDFDVRNDNDETYRKPGTELKDYYCYDLPVVAPAAGYITTIKDGVHDNIIGQENLTENWGNTIIIKHADGLYTKLSHLKPYSVKVKTGDWVNARELIANCGSSGRSPEPHLHFQVQANPYIGSQTLLYPIAYYLVKKENGFKFHSFDIPKEHEIIRNITPSPVLVNALDFVAGKELEWNITKGEIVQKNKWSFYVDIYNKKYIYCNETKAVAYFYNDGTVFYFTDFYGSRKSFLYQFYLSFHKILLGCYEGVEVHDSLMPQHFFDPLTKSVQDFCAPFFHFLKGTYSFEFEQADNFQQPEHITIYTTSNGKVFGNRLKNMEARMYISTNGIDKIEISKNKLKLTAVCVNQ